MPPVEEMYRPGVETFVDVGPLSERLEGAFRPGHFRGVATVVLKLLNIVQPTRAYFGQKDAQQLVVIRRMVRDLDVDVEIVACRHRARAGRPGDEQPQRLPQRRRAQGCPVPARSAGAWRARCGRAAFATRGIPEPHARAHRGEELARIDYVSIADPETLEELDRIQGPALVSMAVRIGKTRLIDNVTLGQGMTDAVASLSQTHPPAKMPSINREST